MSPFLFKHFIKPCDFSKPKLSTILESLNSKHCPNKPNINASADYNVWLHQAHAAVADEVTWGPQAQNRHDINQHWQIGTGLTLGLGEIDGQGSIAANAPLQLKVTQFQQ